MDLARRHLAGLRGVELGASALKPFPGVRSWNLSFPDSEYHDQQMLARRGLPPMPVHAVGDTAHLPFADGALDYVLSAHVLEHMPDVLRALRETDRVVRPGGLLFLMVPHKERTFDRHRPRTPLQHLLADWALRTTIATEPLAPLNHYHVWVTQDFIELVEFLNAVRLVDWELVEVEDTDSYHGDGFTFVLRKRSQRPPPGDGDPRAPIAFHHLVPDLPFQVSTRTIDRVLPGPVLAAAPDVPRGTWRVTPVRAGFPPVADATFVLEVGAPVPPPVVEAVRWQPGQLVIEGRHLTESSWLDVRLPGGGQMLLLPDFADGRLLLTVPPEAPSPAGAQLRVVTPAPGGGTSAPFPLA